MLHECHLHFWRFEHSQMPNLFIQFLNPAFCSKVVVDLFVWWTNPSEIIFNQRCHIYSKYSNCDFLTIIMDWCSFEPNGSGSICSYSVKTWMRTGRRKKYSSTYYRCHQTYLALWKEALFYLWAISFTFSKKLQAFTWPWSSPSSEAEIEIYSKLSEIGQSIVREVLSALVLW